MTTMAAKRGDFLSLSRAELERARQRIKEPVWRQAADGLRAEADRILDWDGFFGAYDCSWYDAQPDRDFAETYVPFHGYCLPAYTADEPMTALLRAGALFGDDRCLERVRQWCVHISRHFRFHVRHHDAGLCYSRIGAILAEAANVLDERFSSDERQQLHRQLEACGEAILANTRHWLQNLPRMPYNNHYASHRRGILVLGLVLNRPDWVAQAIDGVRGFGELIVGTLMDDGLCHESSTLYHYATVNGLMAIAELARHHPELGRDLYRESFANGRTLKQMFDAPLGLLLPNGELPAFGDCYASRAPLWTRLARYYEIAFAVYGDPRYAWLLRRGGERTVAEALFFGADRLEPAEAPHGRSRLWPEHGYALLSSRTGPGYWSQGGENRQAPVVAVLTGDASGIHHHRDKFSIVVSAADRLWIDDVESLAVEGHAFSASIQTGFNRTMLAHNLVVVDEADQRTIGTPLAITEFRELPSQSAVTIADLDARLYPGVRMARAVAVTPDYCLDVFQAVSEQTHTYDWLVHPRADRPVASALDFSPTTLPDRAPYSVLRNVAGATVAGTGVALEWSQAGIRFRADIAALGESGAALAGELIRAEWPVKSDGSAGGREMFMVRYRTPRADIVALYQAPTVGEDWRVVSSCRLFNGAHDEIRITVGNGREERRHVIRGI